MQTLNQAVHASVVAIMVGLAIIMTNAELISVLSNTDTITFLTMVTMLGFSFSVMLTVLEAIANAIVDKMPLQGWKRSAD